MRTNVSGLSTCAVCLTDVRTEFEAFPEFVSLVTRGRLLENDDSRVTGKSLDPQDHRYVVWPGQPWRSCMGAIATLG